MMLGMSSFQEMNTRLSLPYVTGGMWLNTELTHWHSRLSPPSLGHPKKATGVSQPGPSPLKRRYIKTEPENTLRP